MEDSSKVASGLPKAVVCKEDWAMGKVTLWMGSFGAGVGLDLDWGWPETLFPKGYGKPDASAPPHRFQSPRLSLMLVRRRNALGWTLDELAAKAMDYRPSRVVTSADCAGLEDASAPKPSLGGVVIPVARALGYSRREVGLTWRLDQAESRLAEIAARVLSAPAPSLRVCAIESAPSNGLSAFGRSKIPGGLPVDVTVPEELARAKDFGRVVSWATDECRGRGMYGWLKWNGVLRLRISPDGKTTPEFPVQSLAIPR